MLTTAEPKWAQKDSDPIATMSTDYSKMDASGKRWVSEAMMKAIQSGAVFKPVDLERVIQMALHPTTTTLGRYAAVRSIGHAKQISHGSRLLAIRDLMRVNKYPTKLEYAAVLIGGVQALLQIYLELGPDHPDFKDAEAALLLWVNNKLPNPFNATVPEIGELQGFKTVGGLAAQAASRLRKEKQQMSDNKAPAKTDATTTPASEETDKKRQLLKLLEGEATDAGWRLAGKQFLKMTRDPIVAFLSRQLGDDDSVRAKVAEFMKTDLGEALLASMISMGLQMLPETTGEIPKKLAKELRVHAMTDVGDVVADLLMGPLRQVAVMYLQNVPKEPAALPAESSSVVRFPTVETAQTETVGSGVSKKSSVG